MISRLFTTLIFAAAATPAFAHPGHVGAADGHSHLLGWALLGLAAAGAVAVLAVKNRGSFLSRFRTENRFPLFLETLATRLLRTRIEKNQ